MNLAWHVRVVRASTPFNRQSVKLLLNPKVFLLAGLCRRRSLGEAPEADPQGPGPASLQCLSFV